jgi:hypothetical protein
MSVMFAAIISFLAITMLLTHLSQRAVRRLVGYAGWVDLLLHGTVIALFMGTSTLGLLQAELTAVLFSLSLRGYRRLWGYERLTTSGWKRYAGRWTGR